MELIGTDQKHKGRPGLYPDNIPEDITEEDERVFWSTVSTDLNEEQKQRIIEAPESFPHQRDVLGVHWHPEFVPLDLIERRVGAMFPNGDNALLIPTQHNELLTLGGYAGVEVDCFSSSFDQKVQLLLHLTADKAPRATKLRSMLDYTFQYRASQLFELLDAVVKPRKSLLTRAVEETGADPDLVRFSRIVTRKVQELLDRNLPRVPRLSLKNKLLRDFLDALRPEYGDRVINRAQAYLKVVKELVKAEFSMKYFYRTSEIIEEARGLGACIVIPHPEQFWPILLADYDVDGFEVWNPQSRTFTEFLISAVEKINRRRGSAERRIMIFMGDDTHVGEKVRPPSIQVKSKAGREIGVQPAWDDLAIRKKLIISNMDRPDVIGEYRNRLNG